MYVRLGFAVAVMVRPEILIVDEVIAVGDEEFQRKCYDYLYDLRRAGTSMVVVSHGLGQITDLCDEALWLEHGKVQEVGPARQVVRAYLDDVNDREIERAGQRDELSDQRQESATGAPMTVESILLDESELPVRPQRRGSGEMWVTGLEFLDDANRVAGLLISGRSATLRVHYRAETDLEGVVLGLGFWNMAEVPIAGINNAHLGTWAVPRGLASSTSLRIRCSWQVVSTGCAPFFTLDVTYWMGSTTIAFP